MSTSATPVASRRSGWYVRLPIGAVVRMPDGTTYCVVDGGDLEPIPFGGFPHGLMATEPLSTRKP